MLWKTLPRPITILAPMEDVTDTVFRRLVLACGRPAVFFTEFTSAEGMLSKGSHEVMQRLRYEGSERPLIAQLWGTKPAFFLEAARIVRELGFDGIDLNMGCPAAKIVKKGACAGLIEQPKVAASLIRATQEGAGGLPISVKTRLGFHHLKTLEWSAFLLDQGLDALLLHARIAAQMSQGQALWEELPKVVALRDKMGLSTAIIGNGDIGSLAEAHEKAARFGVDGVMIGRGIFADLFLFHPSFRLGSQTPLDRLSLLLAHTRLFDHVWQGQRPFALLKRFFKNYLHSVESLSSCFVELMEARGSDDVELCVDRFLKRSKPLPQTSLPADFWAALPRPCHQPSPLPLVSPSHV